MRTTLLTKFFFISIAISSGFLLGKGCQSENKFANFEKRRNSHAKETQLFDSFIIGPLTTPSDIVKLQDKYKTDHRAVLKSAYDLAGRFGGKMIHAETNPTGAFDDTQYTVTDIYTLIEYLNDVEENGATKVRFVFGQYDKDSTYQNPELQTFKQLRNGQLMIIIKSLTANNMLVGDPQDIMTLCPPECKL